MSKWHRNVITKKSTGGKGSILTPPQSFSVSSLGTITFGIVEVEIPNLISEYTLLHPLSFPLRLPKALDRNERALIRLWSFGVPRLQS